MPEKEKILQKQPFSGRVIFDHQPKTAGTAITDWLRSELGSGTVTPALIGSHRELITQYGGCYPIISGHIDFANNEILDARYQYITILRDPLDRVLSWLYFVVKNHTKSELNDLYSWVKQFLDSEGEAYCDELKGYISNIYVEHFSSIDSLASYHDNKLNNALNNIKNYHVVGIYENMPHFLLELSVALDIPSVESIEKKNVTHSRLKLTEISDKLKSNIEKLNQQDIIFYEQVKNWKQEQGYNFQEITPVSNKRWSRLDIEFISSKNRKISGNIRIKNVIKRLSPGRSKRLTLDIFNGMENKWDSNRMHPLFLSYRWLTLSGSIYYTDEGISLPKEIIPHETCQVNLLIDSPKEPGDYILMVSLLTEDIFLSESNDFNPARIVININFPWYKLTTYPA